MEQDAKKRFGDRVRRARRDLDLKQEELAEMLGTSQAVVSNVENGVSAISAPDLPRWAEALNKPIMYFFDDHALDWQRRALDILAMLPEDQLEVVLRMLKYMALGMNENNLLK
ncbi:helix-turn-helix transcriptional regulator [Phototrophicus methaneseepsis]|uniref:Helix-turn-helix transcriptional regulator n=1 Tax=Phototrophicus methaneseepsis TaxID=2710758 RepID=A0A7S8IDL7_9CHLR|nr:helix-turn-helix transcriptional regulator [Phototrophicus methaneseepsis]QPC80938.1 helix-turn-helix transcriptional regulator [Phototrophicus methaneseepsis]